MSVWNNINYLYFDLLTSKLNNTINDDNNIPKYNGNIITRPSLWPSLYFCHINRTPRVHTLCMIRLVSIVKVSYFHYFMLFIDYHVLFTSSTIFSLFLHSRGQWFTTLITDRYILNIFVFPFLFRDSLFSISILNVFSVVIILFNYPLRSSKQQDKTSSIVLY